MLHSLIVTRKEIVVLIIEALCVALQDGMTALIFASNEGRVDPVKALLADGADKEAKITAGSVRACAGMGWWPGTIIL